MFVLTRLKTFQVGSSCKQTVKYGNSYTERVGTQLLLCEKGVAEGHLPLDTALIGAAKDLKVPVISPLRPPAVGDGPVVRAVVDAVADDLERVFPEHRVVTRVSIDAALVSEEALKYEQRRLDRTPRRNVLLRRRRRAIEQAIRTHLRLVLGRRAPRGGARHRGIARGRRRYTLVRGDPCGNKVLPRVLGHPTVAPEQVLGRRADVGARNEVCVWAGGGRGGVNVYTEEDYYALFHSHSHTLSHTHTHIQHMQ